MCKVMKVVFVCFFFSSRRRHTRYWRDWSSDVCSSDLVGSDRAAPGLEHARRRDVPTFTCALRDHPDRAAWDRALAAAIGAHRPDLVVSAGFMKIVGPAVLGAFGGRLLNTHPALLPAFPGANAVRDALAAGAEVTGSTVHWVDAGVDTGPVIAQREVPVLPGDDEARLHERIKHVERELLVETVARVVTGLGTQTTEDP